MEEQKLIKLTIKLEKLDRDTRWSLCDIELISFILGIVLLLIGTIIVPGIAAIFFNTNIDDKLWVGKQLFITFSVGFLLWFVFFIYTNRTYKMHNHVNRILQTIRLNKDNYTKISCEIYTNLPKRIVRWLEEN